MLDTTKITSVSVTRNGRKLLERGHEQKVEIIAQYKQHAYSTWTNYAALWKQQQNSMKNTSK